MYLSRRKRIALILLNVPVALVLGVFILDKVVPSNARRALPASATDIHEYYDDAGFNLQGDFSRFLKAKMPKSEMPGFAAKLGLNTRYNAAAFPVEFSGSPAWWDPPATPDGAYVQLGPGSEGYSLAKYKGGYVYFKAISW
ncbi:MAG: hypothetical protein V4671_24615 [Armatimonadota bacterium]